MATFSSSIAALAAIEQAETVRVLVTRDNFAAPRDPNGVSLLLVARRRVPELKAVFVCSDETQQLVADYGTALNEWRRRQISSKRCGSCSADFAAPSDRRPDAPSVSNPTRIDGVCLVAQPVGGLAQDPTFLGERVASRLGILGDGPRGGWRTRWPPSLIHVAPLACTSGWQYGTAIIRLHCVGTSSCVATCR